MKRWIASLALFAGVAVAQSNPYPISFANPVHMTANGTSVPVGLTDTSGVMRRSWTGGTIQLVGTGLSAVSLSVTASPDGVNYYAWPICTIGTTPVCANTQNTSINAVYTLAPTTMLYIKYTLSSFSGTAVDLTLSLIPNATASAGASGSNPSGIGIQSTVNTTPACVTASGSSPSNPTSTPNVEPIVSAGVLKIRPTGINKVLMIYGASAGQGVGASDYAHSWAGLLTTALTPSNYTVLNSSCSGNTVAQLINRFYGDVAPFRPDIVIICPFTVNDSYNIVTWRNGIIQLAKMIRQIGAIPVVLQPGADTNYTLQQFQNVKDVEKLLASMDIPTLDVLSATGDPTTGHYLSGLSLDGLHMTDAGQFAAYNSFPLTMFDQLIYGKQFGKLSNPCTSTTHSWKASATLSNTVPLTLTLDRAATSFTFASCMNIPAATGSAIAFMSFQGAGEAADGNMRLRQNATTGTIAIASTALNPICTSSTSPTGFHTIALSYQATTNIYTLYSDGAVLCSGTGGVVAGTTSVTTVGFFNDIANSIFPAKSYAIGPTFFYRTSLFPEQLLEMAVGGFVHPSALDWAANFTTYASSAINVAYTPPNLALTVNNLMMAVTQQIDSQ